MDTSIAVSEGRRRRRIHSAEFKAHIVAACCKPGVSSASVAMANGINANLVRRWVNEVEAGTEIELGERRTPVRESKAGDASGSQVPARTTASTSASAGGRRHPHRVAARRDGHHGHLAGKWCQRVCGLDARAAARIRIDAVWLSVEPIDMRAGAERLLARVVQVFGAPLAASTTWWRATRCCTAKRPKREAMPVTKAQANGQTPMTVCTGTSPCVPASARCWTKLN